MYWSLEVPWPESVGWMARIQRWGILESQEARLVPRAAVEWCREYCLVVTDIEPSQYFDENPRRAIIQHGHTFWTWMPTNVGKLVDAVPGPLPEL